MVSNIKAFQIQLEVLVMLNEHFQEYLPNDSVLGETTWFFLQARNKATQQHVSNGRGVQRTRVCVVVPCYPRNRTAPISWGENSLNEQNWGSPPKQSCASSPALYSTDPVGRMSCTPPILIGGVL